MVLALQGRGAARLLDWPPPILPAWPPEMRNFPEVFSNPRCGNSLPFARFYLNSAIIAVLSVSGTVLTSSVAAFAFARMRFRGRDVIFIIMLSTLMVPPQVTLIPQLILFRQLGWYDTLYPLWCPTGRVRRSPSFCSGSTS